MKASHGDQMFERMSQGVWQVDASGKTIFVNSRMSAMVGYSAEELAVLPSFSLVCDEDRSRLASRKSGVRDDFTCRMTHKDGSQVFVSVEAICLRRGDGEYDGTIALVSNLTEQKRAEEKLQASDVRFRMLVDAVKDYAIFLLDSDGTVASWSSGAQLLKGYTSAEIIGQHFSVFYTAGDRERGDPERELKVAEADGRFEAEGWRERKDGSRFWANVLIEAVKDVQRNLVGFSMVTRDLTERQAAARRLQIVESAPDGILLVDRNGRIVHANPQTARLFGYPREALIGQSVDALLPERFRADHGAHRATFEASPSVRPVGGPGVSLHGMRMDGTEFPAEVSLSTHEGTEGALFIAFIRDVTDQRRLQREQLRDADRVARLQAATGALGAAIDVTAVAEVMVSAGLEAAQANAGGIYRIVENGHDLERVSSSYSPVPENVATGIHDVRFGGRIVGGRYRFSIDARAPICDVARSRTGLWMAEPSELGVLYPALAGVVSDSGWLSVAFLPLISRGEALGVLLLAFTEKRELDSEERAFLTSLADQCALALDRAELYEEAVASRDRAERATKMRDEFLAIVAHDLGNPLYVAGLWATLIRQAAGAGAEGETVRDGAEKIKASVTRMATLIRDLVDATAMEAGQLEIQKTECELETLVSETADALAPLCAEKKLAIRVTASATRLTCDPNRVQQVLGNLIGNAIKLTPEGGKITVEALTSQGEVRFTVADGGPGISDGARKTAIYRGALGSVCSSRRASSRPTAAR